MTETRFLKRSSKESMRKKHLNASLLVALLLKLKLLEIYFYRKYFGTVESGYLHSQLAKLFYAIKRFRL